MMKIYITALIITLIASVCNAQTRTDKIFVPQTPEWPATPPKSWTTYHLAHPGPWSKLTADPNCAIFYKGRYHLFYICQIKRKHCFAHVSSTDMVHWKWHPTTLLPQKMGHQMFSGTAFLTKDGKPAIIYHGLGSGRNQIAFALDDNLDEWSKPIAIEPKTADGKLAKMRHWDPDCWLMNDSYYSIGGGKNPTLAKSKDLKEWEFLGDFWHADFPADLGVSKNEDLSCANLFRIGNKWMLACISHALGGRYYLGDFKDGKFLPDHHAVLNWARWDYFAPESLLTPDGRRVMWAWCTPRRHAVQKTKRAKNFPSLLAHEQFPQYLQSLPRELSLPEDGNLRIMPLRELQSLRTNPREEQNITVKRDTEYALKNMAGDTMELELVIKAPTANEFGIKLLCAEDGSGGFAISFGKRPKGLECRLYHPPFELEEGEDLTLRIFIDKSMIEVFANDRQAAVAWHEYDPKDLHVSLFSKGGDLKVKKVSAWKMKSIYPKAAAKQK